MIKIDPEFKALIPPLTGEEYRQLEQNILADGIRDPLVVWGGAMLDGHNRLQIAAERGLKYKTVEMEFKNRDAAKDLNEIPKECIKSSCLKFRGY